MSRKYGRKKCKCGGKKSKSKPLCGKCQRDIEKHEKQKAIAA